MKDDGGKKNKKKKYYQSALTSFREMTRENDYIITKGNPVEMQNVRYWIIGDYYSALEQILKDNDRAKQIESKNKLNK